MYKLNLFNAVTRIATGETLPAKWENNALVEVDPHSPLVKQLREWIALGNTPEPADPPPPPIDYSDSDNLDKTLKALALCIAQVGGLSAAQMKTLFKQKWDALP